MPFDLEAYLAARRSEVETALGGVFAGEADVPESLRKAIEYSLLAGGKRLRPILALASCEAVGGHRDIALPLACALEMIHTYSLVHDDLPAMDNDDFRRGRPTSHKAFGEAVAILVGDALLTDAFRVAARSPADPRVVVAVIAELAGAAGAAGMVGGQIVDVESTGKSIGGVGGGGGIGDRDALDRHLSRLHRMKTGALLLCSIRAGAMLGGAGDDAMSRLSRYGEALGLAFQIVDDVLDVTADLQTLGKDPGSDRDAGKVTFVDLLGIEGAGRRAREVMMAGIDALYPLGPAAEPLRALGRYTIDRDR